MDALERERLRREIVGDLAPLLFEKLAAESWGRALVEVIRGPDGEAIVAGIDVEEIVGDEARVDAAFGGGDARAALPLLAKATEALCGLAGVELDEVRGGTFVRVADGMGWLPGLVRTPSLKLDRERDELVERLGQKNERLRARFAADRVELDVEGRTARWLSAGKPRGQARATILGTFAFGTRTWAWGWHNPSLGEDVRRAVSAVTDALEDRDLWEITTPAFATDEPTAWALAAFVCDRAGADGVQRVLRGDGALLVLLRDVTDVG